MTASNLPQTVGMVAADVVVKLEAGPGGRDGVIGHYEVTGSNLFRLEVTL